MYIYLILGGIVSVIIGVLVYIFVLAPANASPSPSPSPSSSPSPSPSSSPSPISGILSDWSNWSNCSRTCGTGTQTRTRTYTEPQNGGSHASDYTNLSETRDCNTQPCPINGGFSDWVNSGLCSASCGGGKIVQNRTCTNPPPQHGGANCTGDTRREVDCNTQPCPIDGVLSDWSGWSTCSKECGTGTQTRTRTYAAPQHGGSHPFGYTNLSETQNCNTQPCPINGGFTVWTDTSICTEECGGGTKTQMRSCTNPPPQHGGANCVGDTQRQISCNTQACPPGTVGRWSDFTVCDTTKACQTSQRTRVCRVPPCTVPLKEKRTCGTISDNCFYQLRDERHPDNCLTGRSQTDKSRLQWDWCARDLPNSYWQFRRQSNGQTLLYNRGLNMCLQRYPNSGYVRFATCNQNDVYQHYRMNRNNTIESYSVPSSDTSGTHKCIVNGNYTRPPIVGDAGTRVLQWVCDDNAEKFTQQYPQV